MTLTQKINAALLAIFASAASMAADVSVIVGGEIKPGVYGRVEIGTQPPPVVVYPRPVIIAPAPVVVAPQPVYMHVPPGHAKKWGKHCHKYNACAQPVYFVKGPEYERKGKGHGKGRHKHDD
ncbi:hypothetical protein [Variovorax sp. PCZ-1]|uniref:hypothetical protein n=1 Tax=Variovorax sp. PCZ-1 TaxID=2835533 RepID=UPI001BCC3C75|nr:hypothetical protein [Variovorax sp. PCZ-1]MBS7808297.1 hypothetical protein [Variovorax sp. PCZ-1]